MLRESDEELRARVVDAYGMWGLVHIGDRFYDPLCRIYMMTSVVPSTSTEPVTCLQCLAREAAP